MTSDNEEIRITLRLPAPLRDRLAEGATENARSMNGEIVARLENSFGSNVDPKALADAFAIAEDMRARIEQQWDYVHELEKKLAEDRQRFQKEMREKRAELASYVWERRTRERERTKESLERKEEKLREIRDRYTARFDALDEREKELNEAIARFNAREKELGDVVRSLSSGANMLARK